MMIFFPWRANAQGPATSVATFALDPLLDSNAGLMTVTMAVAAAGDSLTSAATVSTHGAMAAVAASDNFIAATAIGAMVGAESSDSFAGAGLLPPIYVIQCVDPYAASLIFLLAADPGLAEVDFFEASLIF